MTKPTAIICRNKRELLDMLERVLPEGSFILPIITEIDMRASSKKKPNPSMKVDFLFPTDSLNEDPNDCHWMASTQLWPIVVGPPRRFAIKEEQKELVPA